MRSFSYKAVIAFFGLSLAASIAYATTFKIATLAPDGTTWMEEMRSGAEEIDKRTEGRVRFKFYPGGVMGNDKSVLKKIRLNQLQGGALTAGSMVAISNDMQVYGLPMLFNSYAEVDSIRPRIDPLLKEDIAEHGFVCLGLSEGGFAYLMSSEPLRTIEELQSHKVWMPEGDRLTEALFTRMGVPPIPLSLADVYTGLQTGLIDTVTSTPMGAVAFQWHTRIGAVTDVPLAYVAGGLVVNKKPFDKLRPEDQGVVREVMDGVFERMDKLSREDNRQAIEALKNQGIDFVETSEAERARWKVLAVETIEAADGGIADSETYREVLRLLAEMER